MSSSIQRSTPSRRRFLQQVAVTGLAAGPGAAFLASCATGGGDDDADESADEEPADNENVSDDNPLGIDPTGEVEIFIFNGGFGDAYATEVHQPMLLERWPDLTIDHNAEVDMGGALQARLVAGDPPDFINNSGDGQMDLGQLASDGQLADLTPLLDAPSWDDPSVQVRDMLLPGTIETGTYSGTPQVLWYAFTVFGIWYNQTLMDENGWEAPATWDDMMALCAEVKSAGIAPWVYQGLTAPRYIHTPLLTMAAVEAGEQVLIDIDNLVEGAWQHESVVQAADWFAQLKANDYYLEGVEGMEFRDAQGLWARGEALFCPSGSWLENEEADAIAEDETFQMAMITPPLMSASGSAMPAETIRASASEPYIVPSQAANAEAGMEYMRAMISVEGARGFSEQVSSLTSVAGAAEGVEFEQPGLNSARAALEAADTNVVNWYYPNWYVTMENPGIDQVTGSLLRGEITAQEWAEQAEAVAASIRDDDSIDKQTREA